MRYWLALGLVKEVEQLVELARLAEQLGFHGVTLADHLVMPATFQSRYPYSPTGEWLWPPATPWPDPWAAIGAMGAATRTLRFASNLYLSALRDPFSAAKSIATASVVTGGRLVCGLGTGWLREEYDLLQIDFTRRSARLVETLAVMRKLWTGKIVEHHGNHFDFGPVLMQPAPVSTVPVMMGGASQGAMRRAVQLGDGWSGVAYTRKQASPALARLRALLDDAHRAGPFDVMFALTERYTPEAVRELEALGVTGLISTPWVLSHKDVSSFEAKRAYMQTFAARVITAIG